MDAGPAQRCTRNRQNNAQRLHQEYSHIRLGMISLLCQPLFLYTYTIQGMRMFEFIFLKRNWTHDQKHLGKAFDKIARDRQPIWLMLFPEGTLISDQTMEINLNYAEKAHLSVNDNT